MDGWSRVTVEDRTGVTHSVSGLTKVVALLGWITHRLSEMTEHDRARHRAAHALSESTNLKS